MYVVVDMYVLTVYMLCIVWGGVVVGGSVCYGVFCLSMEMNGRVSGVCCMVMGCVWMIGNELMGCVYDGRWRFYEGFAKVGS